MPWIIDAHEDLAWNIQTFHRDYRRSVAESRELEKDTPHPARNGGEVLIGWPEYQKGQVAVVFGTLFTAPRRYQAGDWDTQVFATNDESYRLYQQQWDSYQRLCETSPDMFRMVASREDLRAVLAPWEEAPAEYPERTHPVGLVLLIEGIEGLRSFSELEEWAARGVRAIGPVWGGTRFCGGTNDGRGFTREGHDLLKKMAELNLTLDISHMNEESSLTALDVYEGAVMASHANCRALLKGAPNERHFSDQTIHHLVERGGVMGVIPFSRFLKPDWNPTDDRRNITLNTLAAHIDHICQIAGDARHAALGTDFDGGFGYPAVPLEIDNIADLQKLVPLLTERGYSAGDIDCILGKNWARHLEETLPE